MQNIWEKWYEEQKTESKSGHGSSLSNTIALRKMLAICLKQFDIQSMVDAPCGDFHWMKYVLKNKNIQYLGIDIIKKNIINNNLKYQNKFIKFKHENIIDYQIPEVDLIFCRDCLVHLCHEDNKKIIQNFKQSKSKYVMMTTFTDKDFNEDIKAPPQWRTLNMRLPPYNFPQPILIINEEFKKNNLYKNKSIGLWRLSDL